MRLLTFMLVFALFGACSKEESSCEGWKYVGSVDSKEKYSGLFVDTRDGTLADETVVLQNADFCEPPLSPSPGIYRIEGDVYENCQGKKCVEITEWLQPYCIPELVMRDTQQDLFGEWQISHISTTDTLYYPDCNYGTFWIYSDSINYADLHIGGDVDSTRWFNLTIGHGHGFYFAEIFNDTIVGSDFGTGNLAYYGYYYHFFEDRLSNVHLSDTMIYQIEGNQMTLLNLSDSSAIHLFKE